MVRERKTRRRRKKRILLWRFIQRNDVVLKIYTSFAFVLAMTGVLIGLIFMMLYQKNYIRSYTKLLTRQGKIIAKHVSSFSEKKQPARFERYNTYIDEIERAENTDVWIVSNNSAENPLSEEYINARADETILSADMSETLEKAFQGKISAISSYDKVYSMTTLCVSLPVKKKQGKEIIGAVTMVSMIDRQTMGLREGGYLISLSVLMAVIISYLVAAVFSRYLSRPLEKIGKRIGTLASGDYSKIEVKRPYSQLGILEKSLNHLSGELAKAEKQREDLEQVRRDFFANVSHELRTPITVLRGYTETLADGILEGQEQIDELYHRMLQECHGMERLVEDLFILSKMKNPDFKIDMEPVSLQQIFGDIMRSGKMIGREKEIHFHMDAPEEDPCLIMGDYGRLRQMFMVIVDNAVKFSKEQGNIDISIQKEEGRYKVAIRDYGVGISEEQLPFIFEKFYTSKMRQNEKGTGLGLMIARQIALRHGGDIQVDSVLQKGTAFTFAFDECTCAEDFA
ncbi:sensor histidine kinase [bacterium 1xD8-6]|jgi:Signal transduction histidine kinase|nr:sensor histidine kinase [bacterium D16-36]RKI71262.1 sensor histidine kinase [bacterium 1xD8-6]